MPPGHNKDTLHPHRPEWWNGISLGNAITIIALVIGASISWGVMAESQSRQDDDIAAVETRANEKAQNLREDLRRIEEKIDRLLMAQRSR